ncbi:MAG: shikimate kinase [Firmicutes bacterium]|nr:shikimate kinase [Bacillota bacterium]
MSLWRDAVLLIALIGFTGSGKSTLGRALAMDYGLPCYDSDKWIEQQSGSSIAHLFALEGEASFREREADCILQCIRSRSTGVLVTGGGAVLKAQTRELLRTRCFTVHVQAPLDVIWQRLQGQTDRPLLQGSDPYSKLSSLYDSRSGLYDFAHTVVSSLDMKRAASQIVAGWLQFTRDEGRVDGQ